MNAEIENIIVNHDFVELSAEQRAAVHEWATSEEEYATMKQIITSAPLLNADVAPSPKLKTSLMDTFAATYPASSTANEAVAGKNKKVIYIWFRTAAAVAAVLFAVFLIYPLINSSDKSNLMAENIIEKKKEQPADLEKQKTTEAKENSVDELDENNSGEEIQVIAPVAPQPQLAPTTGPYDGKAHPRYYTDEDELEILDADMTLTAPTMDFSPTSIDRVMPNNMSTSFTYSGGVAESAVANGNGVGMVHSDRLAVADLPEQSRQVIHEQPELLNLLHTSF